MEKRYTLCVPTESLHEENKLLEMSNSELTDDFRIDSIIESPSAIESSTLVSASLFTKGGNVFLPRVISADWFSDNVIIGPPSKYYEPLHDRRNFYRGNRLRLYISSNLEPLIPWLFELGIDEVCIMASKEAGFMPGMLWRYLPIHDESYDWLVCTGIDCLGILGRELVLQNSQAAASVHTARFWMPFGGPFATRPIANASNIAAAMSGFRQDWLSPKLETFEGQVLSRCREGKSARFNDAAFLSFIFWNKNFITSCVVRRAKRGASDRVKVPLL